MMPNLWTDVEALARLAVSERAAAQESRHGIALAAPFPSGAFPPFPERTEFTIHLAIVIADVSGKGVPAAVLMAFTRSMVRNVSAFSVSPGDTLTRVNKILYDARLGPMFVTIFLGWYDTRSGALLYANAGHPKPYVIGRDGRVSAFGEATGPILGILDVKRYGEGKERIGVGERLVLYTDGVTEAPGPDGEFFGPGRLAALLAGHASEPLGGMLELVARRVDEFQAGRRQDDATLLALLRNS